MAKIKSELWREAWKSKACESSDVMYHLQERRNYNTVEGERDDQYDPKYL